MRKYDDEFKREADDFGGEWECDGSVQLRRAWPAHPQVVAATGEDTKFIYDGLDVVMDDDATTGITKYQSGLGIDDKLKLTNGGLSKYFIADHLGSTAALTDATGAVTEQNSYDSFGNRTNTTFSSRYQYTGREYDSLSGFYYYRARCYDAKGGRFVSEDPIGFAGGDINLYGYVRNQPQWFRDHAGDAARSRRTCKLEYLDCAGRSGSSYRRPGGSSRRRRRSDLRGGSSWNVYRSSPMEPIC